jgi:hypothetical protein
MRQKLSELKEELTKRKHAPIQQTGVWLKSVVQGFGLYFGVPGNSKALKSYRDQVVKMWLKVLRRRSQKGSALTWETFNRIVDKYIPHLRICQPFPEVRFAMTQGRSRMR